ELRGPLLPGGRPLGSGRRRPRAGRRGVDSKAMAKELYGLKILVVEDDVDTRELIEWVLKRAGAEVSSVGSAREALEALEREKPHLLVSDIAMPEEDGHELLKKIRALPPE